MTSNLKASLPEWDNYANYLLLPLLGFGKPDIEVELVNTYATANGKIAIMVNIDSDVRVILAANPWYLTDFEYKSNILVLFNCPPQFEKDMQAFLLNEFGDFSDAAKDLIYKYSGLTVDFKTAKQGIVSSRLIKVLRGELTEPPLRECDVLYDVDTDLTNLERRK